MQQWNYSSKYSREKDTPYLFSESLLSSGSTIKLQNENSQRNSQVASCICEAWPWHGGRWNPSHTTRCWVVFPDAVQHGLLAMRIWKVDVKSVEGPHNVDRGLVTYLCRVSAQKHLLTWTEFGPVTFQAWPKAALRGIPFPIRQWPLQGGLKHRRTW